MSYSFWRALFQDAISANPQKKSLQCRCQVHRLSFWNEFFIYVWKSSSSTYLDKELFYSNHDLWTWVWRWKLTFWISAYIVFWKRAFHVFSCYHRIMWGFHQACCCRPELVSIATSSGLSDYKTTSNSQPRWFLIHRQQDRVHTESTWPDFDRHWTANA